ncbi:MAG: 50S ribosomal protein L7ae [Candidatus Latescibacteria bacterium]|jgi:ribosomal protein L7Ae-like RNA K-turn-binding protein|nr:50S ribosomal protein L7ae [Candidatus Latescibacterota bacterium]
MAHSKVFPKVTYQTNTSILGLLGLALRSRKARAGATAVEGSIRSGKARLVLIASDSSDGTKKQFMKLSTRFEVPFIEQHTQDEYGVCFHGAPRSVVVINDRHFADGMLKKTGNTSPQAGRIK